MAVGDFVLEDGREADAVFAENAGDLGEDAGFVFGHEAEVIAGFELLEGENLGRGG